MTQPPRCRWAEATPLLQHYHDVEWGKPPADSRALWETLMLESFQAGLSWRIVLERREALKDAFAQFQPEKIVHFTAGHVEELMHNTAIIRSRAKIQAMITNARAYLTMQAQGEDFTQFLHSFVPQYPIINDTMVPLTRSPLSQNLARALKKRGFKFTGPVIVYAWLQAIGMVDDHEPHCFNHHTKRH